MLVATADRDYIATTQTEVASVDIRRNIYACEVADMYRTVGKGYSANQLAKQYFNGGGHECAAGGRLYFPENIENPTFASAYIEDVAARLLHSDPAEDVNR